MLARMHANILEYTARGCTYPWKSIRIIPVGIYQSSWSSFCGISRFCCALLHQYGSCLLVGIQAKTYRTQSAGNRCTCVCVCPRTHVRVNVGVFKAKGVYRGIPELWPRCTFPRPKRTLSCGSVGDLHQRNKDEQIKIKIRTKRRREEVKKTRTEEQKKNDQNNKYKSPLRRHLHQSSGRPTFA